MNINRTYINEENTQEDLRIIVFKIYLINIMQGVVSLHWILFSSLEPCEMQSKPSKSLAAGIPFFTLHCEIFSALGRKSDICIQRERKKLQFNTLKYKRKKNTKKENMCILGFSL